MMALVYPWTIRPAKVRSARNGLHHALNAAARARRNAVKAPDAMSRAMMPQSARGWVWSASDIRMRGLSYAPLTSQEILLMRLP